MSMSQYDVHPSVEMVRNIITGLPQKTGRDLTTWVALIQKQGPGTKKERAAWLKSAHGLGTNYAGWLAAYASGEEVENGEPDLYLRKAREWVEAMYAGPKSTLRPIFDALLGFARSLGPDIRICPAQTIVPIYRRHVIAQIKPSTRTRIDLGLALGDTPPVKRLLATGGAEKGDRITHRIALGAVTDIDAEVRSWLQRAYERDV